MGPGNAYVAAAKKLVFGQVDIDMIAGPSEVVVIADKTANASFVAADMLAQAEHDEMAAAVLLTPSADLAREVSQEIDRQLKTLSRKKIIEESLGKYGAIIITADIAQAVELANLFAPEHLELMVENPAGNSETGEQCRFSILWVLIHRRHWEITSRVQIIFCRHREPRGFLRLWEFMISTNE